MSTPQPQADVHGRIQQLQDHLDRHIIGQQALTRRLLIALLCDGHLLVEGAPGLAKTTAIKTLAAAVEADFHRIQFTPDLLPADITGTEIYRPQDGDFHFQPGPLFHNLVLADEINRAPAKVQSALLEAMAERQVTVGRKSYPLPELFLVMATQNPIEQEGTYPLPEAQLDRFLMHLRIDYPNAEAERLILRQARQGASPAHNGPTIRQGEIFQARRALDQVHLSPELEDYLVQLVLATREPGRLDGELGQWLRFGASPRATIALDRCARAHAWLQGRDYVLPDDIHALAADVLRHRILLSYQAEAEGLDSDQVIETLLDRLPVP